MSLSMAPIIGGEASDQVLQLLKFLSDPKASAKMADMLNAINHANDENHKLIAEVKKEREAADAAWNKVSTAQADIQKRERDLDVDKKALADAERNLQNREDDFNKKSQAMQDHLNNAVKLDTDAQQRMKQVEAREERLHQGEETLKASVDKHRAWLDSLKPPR